MVWYDYTPLGAAISGVQGGGPLPGMFGYGSGDPTNPDRDALRGQAGAAGAFGGQAAGDFGGATAGMNAQAGYLRDLQAGKNSVSAEQLRQGLQQQLAAQQSMAAGASPQNQAMAARNASMNMARLGYGMSGQQAVAGLAERNQASMALAQLLAQQRGQDVQGAIGGYGASIGGYGSALQNPQKGFWNSGAGPAVFSALSAGSGMGTMGGGAPPGAAMSDERLKDDIDDGDAKATQVLKGLRAKTFRYKDERHGKGEQLGIMAQDLERAGLKHAVFDTPLGKAVDGAKLAASNTAMLVALGNRLSKLEGR